MHTKFNIPQREINENEDPVLDELWSQIEESSVPTEVCNRDFLDLQIRIQHKIRAKRRFRLAVAGSVAASFLVGILMFYLFSPVQHQPTAIAQLQDMGVTVSDNQVRLKIGDRVVLSLDSVARMEQKTPDSVALQTQQGESLSLAESRLLKLEVPAGRRFQLTLSDGTRVWLNASSTLEYPSTFAGQQERRVRLSGEAFFEVSRNEAMPFFVETESTETIRVLGTSFNVSVYPDCTEHATTLVTGKISYQASDKESPLMLVSNQQVTYNSKNETTEIRQVDASVYAAWKDGLIYFEDEALPELARRLSRMYGIEIRVAERLNDYCFTGKISHERGVDYITRLMAETNGIRCEVEHGVLWLK